MNATVDDIDVHIEEAPAFTYSLYDHIDIGKVKGDNSTAIDIIPTNAARAVLGSENMQEQPTSRSRTLRIGEEGATYWKGDVRVEQWTRDVIRCSSVGGNGAWIDPVKEKRLRDVAFGESEVITNDYIKTTWENGDDPLYFPLIDYGSFTDRASSFNVVAWRLRPGIRLSLFLVKAFQEVGYTLSAVGRFADVFPKLVCPAHDDSVGASQGTLERNSASFELTAPVAFVDPTPTLRLYPLTDTLLSDPAGNATAPDTYTAPFDMTVRVRVSGEAIVTGGPVGLTSYSGYWSLRDVNTNAIVGAAGEQDITTINATTFDVNLTAVQADLLDGQQVQLTWATLVNVIEPFTVTFTNLKVYFEPYSTPFREDIRIDIQDAAPDLTVAEALKSLVSMFNLAVVTSDLYQTVELYYFDDFLLPLADGIDWRGKENQEEAAAKVEPPLPLSYRFRYAEDSNDADLVANNAALPYPGYGNGDYVLTNGYDKPIDIEASFAATAMGYTFGTTFIPLMRKEDGEFQVDTYDYVPRILIADGLADGEWTYDGEALTEYPKCYFVSPREVYSLAYGQDGTYGQAASGLIETYYRTRLQRINDAFVFEVSLRLWDDELQSLDFRKPVLVNDGYTDGWYYILTIDQKRFGVDEYTRVELLQA